MAQPKLTMLLFRVMECSSSKPRIWMAGFSVTRKALNGRNAFSERNINSKIHSVKTIGIPRRCLTSLELVTISFFQWSCSGGSVSSRPPFPQTLWRKAIRLTSRAILLCCYPIKKCRQSLRQSRMVCCPRAGQRNGSTSPLSKTASLVAPYVQSAVALSYPELRNLVPASVRNFMGAQSTRLADMSPNLKRTPNE